MRYFFNVAGTIHQPDDKGVEIANMSDARIRAVRFANEHLNQRPELVWLGEEFRVEVTNDEGHLLFTFVAVGVDAPADEGRLRL